MPVRFRPQNYSNITNSHDVAWLAASRASFFDNDYDQIDSDSDAEGNHVDNRAAQKGEYELRHNRKKTKRCSADNAKLAGAKAIRILSKIEQNACLACGPNSCYGAAIAIPQIARSVGWSWTMVGITFNTYFLLLLNYLIQGFVLFMISMELHFVFPFANHMHLCDYGANLLQCPDGPNCEGPGGTPISFSRLYSFETWSVRSHVRDVLGAILPNQKTQIAKTADPGEYGLENYWIRALCVWFFIMSMMPDLENNYELLRIHCAVPTGSEPWACYECPEWDTKANVKDRLHVTELDFVTFQVAGIPSWWKFFNVLVVLLPKCLIWVIMARCGVHYLMETAGIIDVIVNSVALSFVLNIDEMLFERLSSGITQHMMTHLRAFPLFDILGAETESDEIALSSYHEEEFSCGRWTKAVRAFIPWELLKICMLWFLFVAFYYYRNCDQRDDGSWVSKPVSHPRDNIFSVWSMLLGEVTEDVEPSWTMSD